MGNNALTWGVIFFLFSLIVGFISPLISKIFVNKPIEKRYKCKLDLENPKALRVFLYDYFKLTTPTVSIGTAYLFRRNKFIEINPGLNAIHYNIKTAPKKEIVISCITTLSFYVFIAVILVLYVISKLP